MTSPGHALDAVTIGGSLSLFVSLLLSVFCEEIIETAENKAGERSDK